MGPSWAYVGPLRCILLAVLKNIVFFNGVSGPSAARNFILAVYTQTWPQHSSVGRLPPKASSKDTVCSPLARHTRDTRAQKELESERENQRERARERERERERGREGGRGRERERTQDSEPQPRFDPSVRSAIDESQQPTSPVGFLSLKLPRPPCVVLSTGMNEFDVVL